MSRLLATRPGRLAAWAPWLRWATAIVFLVFGVAKFTNHASELRSFRLYGLPAPNTWVYAIGVLEILGGLLLAAGGLTRLAALMLAGDMAGAVIVAGIRHGEVVPSLSLAPVLLVVMVVLLVVGPGRHSLDERLKTEKIA